MAMNCWGGRRFKYCWTKLEKRIRSWWRSSFLRCCRSDTVVRVLGNLLKEGFLFETYGRSSRPISDQATITKDAEVLTEYARQALARTITKQYQAPDGSLQVITLDPRLDRSLAETSGGIAAWGHVEP